MDSKELSAVDPDREHSPDVVGDAFATKGELPSVALTQRFLAQCEHHGSQRFAVRFGRRGPEHRGVGIARIG